MIRITYDKTACLCCKQLFTNGTFGRFNVVFDKNEFINITKLISDYFPDRSLSEFLLRGEDLVKHFDSYVMISQDNEVDKCIIDCVTGIPGKYVSPLIAVHIISFFDASFALLISKSVLRDK